MALRAKLLLHVCATLLARSRTLHAVAAAAADHPKMPPAAPAASAAHHWWKYPDVDVPSLLNTNSQIRSLGPNASIPALQAACEADAACLAFSSAGSL